MPSTNFKTGCALSEGINNKQTPKKTAKKIILSIEPLSVNAWKKLLGIISTKGFKGETSSLFFTAAILS